MCYNSHFIVSSMTTDLFSRLICQLYLQLTYDICCTAYSTVFPLPGITNGFTQIGVFSLNFCDCL